MTTLTICATPPLPTFSSLYQSVQGLLTGPFPVPTFPALPTLPSPMFTGFHSPNIEAVEFAAELQCSQILNLVLALFKPVASFLGLGLDAILPKIPFLNINLIELLEGDASAFIAQLEGIAVGTILGISSFANGLYNNYVIPVLSALQTFQLLVRSYFAALINTLFELVNQVAHILSVGALTLPTIPDFAEMFEGFVTPILSQLLLKVDGILVIPVEISAIIALVGAALSSGIGLAFEIAMPDPLYPTLNMPEFNLLEQLKNLYTNFIVSPLQLILNFILNVLHLGVTIPTICISIAIPSVSLPPLVAPKFFLPTLPALPSVSIPNLSLSVAVPSTPLPSVSLPSISVPHISGNISGAGVNLPSVSESTLSPPSISLGISVPDLSLPSFSVPNITIPTFTFPHLPFPAFQIPSFSLPSFSIPQLPSVPSLPVPNLELNVAAYIKI